MPDFAVGLVEALESPFGGMPGVDPRRSTLFNGFEVKYPIGPYPTGLPELHIPAADKVRGGSRG